MEYFNDQVWRAAAKHDDWYMRIADEYKALMDRAAAKPDEAESIKEAVRSFFEALLEQGEIALGGLDPQLDAERQPIRQVIIHHSKRSPGYYTLARLNAVHLLNLYVPHYTRPSLPQKRPLGRAVTSNHYRDGRMVFYGYHWWVEADGSCVRLLPDEAVGWQAGNWEVNCSSVAICINDDLTHKAPTTAALRTVQAILQEHYGWVAPTGVLGHREVNPKTACPGELFIGDWRAKLFAG